MTSFSEAQRAELRAAAQQSRAEALLESRRRSAAKPPVVRAAEKAQRAQEAVPLMRAVVVERDHDAGRCQWCGDPSPKSDGVCVGHRDLGGIR